MKIDQSRMKLVYDYVSEKLQNTIEKIYQPSGILAQLGIGVIFFLFVYTQLAGIYGYAFFYYDLNSYITTFIILFVISFFVVGKLGISILSLLLSLIVSIINTISNKKF